MVYNLRNEISNNRLNFACLLFPLQADESVRKTIHTDKCWKEDITIRAVPLNVN